MEGREEKVEEKKGKRNGSKWREIKESRPGVRKIRKWNILGKRNEVRRGSGE